MVECQLGRNRQESEYRKQITLHYVSAMTHIVGSEGKESFNNGVSRQVVVDEDHDSMES